MKRIIILFFFISSNFLNAQNNLIKTFYRGDKGVQYFIKPIKYTNNKKSLILDFTLTVKNDSLKKIISNFSIPDNSLNDLVINNNKIKVKKLYDDYESKSPYSRYTMEINLNMLKYIFSSKEIVINDNVFTLKKSLQKKIEMLKQNFLKNLN